MDLCNDRHKEVCYEGGECPVCAYLAEIEDLESQVSPAEEEKEALETQIEEAQAGKQSLQDVLDDLNSKDTNETI